MNEFGFVFWLVFFFFCVGFWLVGGFLVFALVFFIIVLLDFWGFFFCGGWGEAVSIIGM